MAELIVFDLDGTLLDSEGVGEAAFREAFQRTGGIGDPPVAAFKAQAGRPFEVICERLGLPAEIVAEFRAAATRLRSRVRVFDGAQDLLRALTARGATLAVLTGKDRPRTMQLRVERGLIDSFDAGLTPDDPLAAKPAPDGVLWLAARADVDVRSVVLVGDAPSDITAGSTAGATTIGCTWGVSTAQMLFAAGADQVVYSIAQLSAALRVHPGGDISPARGIETPT
ncbi:MAG: HAD family hydrolase [Actinomycetia bacterium]|nr:HAD family hydrolase [Actinomycetes bacterium]